MGKIAEVEDSGDVAEEPWDVAVAHVDMGPEFGESTIVFLIENDI